MADLTIGDLTADTTPASNDLIETEDVSASASKKVTLSNLFINAPADTIPASGIDFSTGIWWEELGRTTLSSAADTITVSSLANRKYLKIYVNLLNSGQINAGLRFNSDSGANYSYRSSINGAADGTATAQTSGQVMPSLTEASFSEINVINVSTAAKFAFSHNISGTTSAAAAPQRLEGQIKWANTADAISSVSIVNGGTGDFDTNSEVVVLGHD